VYRVGISADLRKLLADNKFEQYSDSLHLKTAASTHDDGRIRSLSVF